MSVVSTFLIIFAPQYIYMNGLIISTKSAAEQKFLNSLLKKLGIKATQLSNTEMEDLGMSLLLKKVDRSKKVSRDRIMKKLRS